MNRQKQTKAITAAYTTTDADCGFRLICDSATDFTITLHTATNRINFDMEIDNIGIGIVTCGGQTISQYSHAHVGNNGGNAWVVSIGGGSGGGLPEGFATTANMNLYVGYHALITGSASVTSGSNLITGTGTDFVTDLAVDMIIYTSRGIRKVSSIESATECHVTANFTSTGTATIGKYYVGNDANDGTANDATHALATIAAAVAKIPSVVNHIVTIYLACLDFGEYVQIQYKSGGGIITIRSPVGADPSYVSTISINTQRCNVKLTVSSLTLTMGDDYSSFDYNAILQSVNSAGANGDYGFYFNNGATCYILNCDISNKMQAIYAELGARVTVSNCTGSGNTVGLYASNATIYKIGTAPTGTTPEQVADGGRILGPLSGTTAERPAYATIGYQYFDTTIVKPIWYTGTGWVDATGTGV